MDFMDPEKEAADMLVFLGDPVKAMDKVTMHLNTLHGRAQVLVTLAGLGITVCGFSGARIAASSIYSQVLLISGLAIVIYSAYRVFTKVMRIHWLSHFMGLPAQEAVAAAIRERNFRSKAFDSCCHMFFLGAILYVAAFGHMLIFTKNVP